MDRDKNITTREVFSAQVITAGATVYSDIIPLSIANGHFSVEVELTGDGGVSRMELIENATG